MEATIENNKGVTQFLEKDFEKAKYYYEKAISLDAKNSTALNNLGLLYHQHKQYDKAVDYFQLAIACSEKDTYFLNLANTLACQKLYDKAEKAYFKCIDLNSKNGNAMISLARFYEFTGKPSKATQIWVTLATTYNKAGFKVELAKNYILIESFERALSILSVLNKSMIVNYYVGVCEFYLRNHGLAEIAFKESLAFQPDYSKSRHYLALNYLAIGRNEKALKEFDFLIKFNISNLKFRLEKVAVLINLKKYKMALEEIEGVLKIEAKNEKALYYKNVIAQVFKQGKKGEI